MTRKLLIIAFAANVVMLYLWAFLNGVATCFIYTPALTCVQRWFPSLISPRQLARKPAFPSAPLSMKCILGKG